MWHTNLVVSAGLKMIVCDELPLAFWALSFSAFLSYDSTIYKQATQGQVTKKWMLHLFKSNAIELLSKLDGLKTKMLLWKRTNCFLSTEKIKNVKIRGYFSLFFFIVSSPFSKSFVFEVFSVHKKTQSGVFKFFRFDERFSVNGRPNPRNNDTFSKNILYGAVWTKPLSSPTRKTIQWERLLVFLVCKFNSKRVSQGAVVG